MEPTNKYERAASRGWVWRMIVGVGLIWLSLWGVSLCRQLLQTFIIWPNPSPSDKSSAEIAAWGAWFLFFLPIGVVGVAVLWFALRKLGVLKRLQAYREERIAREMYSGRNQHGSRSSLGEEDLHVGLESLGDEEVARLTKRAHQIAILLGLSTGTFFVLLGVFGLLLMSIKTLIYVAIASGISILAGLAILQRTLRKEDNPWLLPLKIFTRRVLRLHSLSPDSRKTRRSQQLR